MKLLVAADGSGRLRSATFPAIANLADGESGIGPFECAEHATTALNALRRAVPDKTTAPPVLYQGGKPWIT